MLKILKSMISAAKAARELYPDEVRVIPEWWLIELQEGCRHGRQSEKYYDKIIQHVIRGGSLCKYCEERETSCNKATSRTRGCNDFMIKWPPEEEKPNETEKYASDEAVPACTDEPTESGGAVEGDIQPGMAGCCGDCCELDFECSGDCNVGCCGDKKADS